MTAWAFAVTAAAHAFLERAVPAVGSVVHASPARIELRFTQRIEPAFSSVQVFDTAGKRIDRDDGAVDAADATLLRVSLPPLAPGTYRVKWRVLSIDSHVTDGDFSFDVAP